jgi:hypothetical protein
VNLSADNQILAAYKQGMDPEAISEDLGFPVHIVKARLMHISTEYRKACRAEEPDKNELNYSHDEALAIKREYFQLAMATEDEHLKYKILKDLREETTGRKDVVKVSQGNNFNILQLVNGSLEQARLGANKMKELVDV